MLNRTGLFYNKYTLFVVLLLFFFITSLQGFDVTDFGYHFTNQYLVLQYPLSTVHINPMYILSDFAGGVWLHGINVPNVMWGKLGGSILLSFCAMFVFSILKNYFPKRDVFVYVLVCALFLTLYPLTLIDYYTFPALLTIIFLWFFNKMLLTPKNSLEFGIYAFLQGFLFIAIILARFPLILLALILPLAGFYYWITKKPFDDLVHGLKFAVFGCIAATLVFLIIFYELHILGEYTSLLSSQLFQSASGSISTYGTTDTFIDLIRSYVYEYIQVFMGILLFVGGIFFLNSLPVHQKWIKTSLVFLVIIFLMVTAYLSLFSFIALHLLIVFIGFVLLFVGLFFYIDKGESRNLSLLLLVSVWLMIINPVGSNTGIYKSSYAFWLVLPLSLLCIKNLGERTKNTCITFLSPFIPVLLMLMFLSALFFHGVDVYRDDPNRLHLIYPFQSDSLTGTYSTLDRVKVTDDLLSVIRNETVPGDYLLIENNIPMFYYLTETRPALKNPWLSYTSRELLITLEEEREQRGEIQPKLFIYSKINTRNRYWPSSVTPGREKEIENLNYLKERFIGKLNYTRMWENDAFAVYKKPEN